jgi:hypothetical protein
MAMSRKGVFFTVMSLLVVAFLLASQKMTTDQYTVTKADSDAARTRIGVLNVYITTFEQHAQNSLAMAGYYSLQNRSKYIRANHTYLSDVNASMRFCMMNTTYAFNCLNENQTINTSMEKIVRIGRTNYSIDTTYKIDNIWVTEEAPFEVIFWMNISYNISDSFASWQTNATIRAAVEVTGVEDPLFAYEFGVGNYTQQRYFNQTLTKNYQFDNTTFTSMYLADQYIAIPTGRSVLQRYSGDLTQGSLCCGIESVVRTQHVLPAHLANPLWHNWSSVDYMFFQRANSAYVFNCHTQSIGALQALDFPDRYVRLEREHLYNVYRVNGSANYTCVV